MKSVMKVLFSFLLSLCFLVACDNTDTSLKQDFDRSGEELRVTVIFHDDYRDLNKAYVDRFGRDMVEKHGFAIYANPGNKPYWCEIHTLRPKHPDDDAMKVMGHELSHCVFGQFHKKVARITKKQ